MKIYRVQFGDLVTMQATEDGGNEESLSWFVEGGPSLVTVQPWVLLDTETASHVAGPIQS